MKIPYLALAASLLLIQCTKSENLNVNNNLNNHKIYEDSLLSYSNQTKKILVKNLTEQIQKNGVEQAISFCNLKAIPLTNSLEKSTQLKFRRVSDKNRNPNNLANPEELKIIEQYKIQLLTKNKELQPINSEKHYYTPLVTNSMCLQCHGNPAKDIPNNVLQKIKKLYPKDLATGYKENELRGLLVIEK